MLQIDDMRKVVRLRFRRMKKHYRRMEADFDKDAIHDFRVEYKKLRAFLRLLSVHPMEQNARIGNALRRIYQAIGPIRDLQLQIDQLNKERDDPIFPQRYFAALAERLAKQKEEALGVMNPGYLEKSKAKIESRLPGQFPKSAVALFAESGVLEIKKILSKKRLRDAHLHETRKLIKDIWYNSSMFPDELSVPFPWSGWSGKIAKSYSRLAASLGKFQDACALLAELKKSMAGAEEAEILFFRRKIGAALREKKMLKAKILAKLQLLFGSAGAIPATP